MTLASFARPTNAAILPRIKSGEGVLTDVRGLDGSSGRVVAYANSKAPGWTTVIDRPASTVFAPARRGLILELAVIGAAALAVLCIIGWALLRSTTRAGGRAAPDPALGRARAVARRRLRNR